ncbi:MAG: LamG domain-containing protein, partial [candidate division Zixibacteria bacterium]|nr:LamG domain-containing protein [candidate division Zixibacteria bacterium]
IDSTGNDNDGTSQGSMTSEDLVDGKIGKALDFDGSNNSIRRAGLSLSTRGSFTLEAIVKLSQSGVKQRLVTLEDATAPDNGPQFFIRIDTSNFAQVFSRGHENDTFAIVTDDVDLNDATYHFIAGTINGDIGKAELFVAGVSQGSVTQSQFTSDTMPDIVLGSFLGDLNEQFLKGVIDEVRISNIIRSAEWIKASRNNQFSPGTFVIEGTPATPGGAAPTSIFYGPLVGPFGGPI